MSEVERLLQRYLDNRDGLNDAELSMLVDGLQESPELATELKEQLFTDELLGQQFAFDRCDFSAQMQQRISDLDREGELNEQAVELREIAKARFDELAAASRRRRRMQFGMSVVLVVLVAVGIYYGYPQLRDYQHIAQISSIHGPVTVSRDGEVHMITPPFQVMHGDRYSTPASGSLTVRYADGTEVRARARSSLIFEVTPWTWSKNVFLQRGELVASVTPQRWRQAMEFETPQAVATVVGTELTLRTSPVATRLEVTKGVVKLARKSNDLSMVVTADQMGIVAGGRLVVKDVEESVYYDGLVFGFARDQQKSLRLATGLGENDTLSLEPYGSACLDHNMSLVLNGGSYRSEVTDELLLNSCRASNELTIEAIIDPLEIGQPGPLPIICFGRSLEESNFALFQDKNELLFLLRTRNGDEPAQLHAITLVSLPDDNSHHVLITYRSGEAVCYLDGNEVLRHRRIRGDFSAWQVHPLVFGQLPDEKNVWKGRLSEVSVYNRFTDGIAARRASTKSQSAVRAWPKVEQFVVDAIEQEAIEYISPYKDTEVQPSLVISRYQVQSVVTGDLEETTFVAARWDIVDSHHRPVPADLPPPKRLTLERVKDNPPLERFLIKPNGSARAQQFSPSYFVVEIEEITTP